MPKETSRYDDLVFQATDRLKSDPQLLNRMLDRLLAFPGPESPSPFSGFVAEGEQLLRPFKVERWQGQERSGRVTAADLSVAKASSFDLDTHTTEDDFLVIISRRPMTEKAVDNWLKKERPADPRIVVWAPAELKDDERATLAGVLAHLRVADENPQTGYGKQGLREFKRESYRAYAVLQGIYGRGVAKTSRTSINISLVGGVQGALAAMASEALDTCYRSREIDFGNRKFDTPNAVKLINGLVKLGVAVSEGDVLWSAVENFAAPLGLVRREAPKRLDPSDSQFYLAIRKKVEDRAGAGIDVRTVYNWFTGYNPEDGKESAGLTRRMVDIYLLCLAQQGVIRITPPKGAKPIDRATIKAIDFRPDVLRSLARIELPRALDNFEIFAPYLEILSGKPGSLGPKYDKASADDALTLIWTQNWLDRSVLDRIDRDVRELFSALAKPDKTPFDDLLLYWMEFSEEARPAAYQEEEVFNSLCRAILRAAGVSQVEDLTPDHLTRFRENHRLLAELRESFAKTSLLLIRAAKLASAPLPEKKAFREIEQAQRDLLKELEQPQDLILNPDTVNTRLTPRLATLEEPYAEAYLAELVRLASIQDQLQHVQGQAERSSELQALKDFADELPEARSLLERAREKLRSAPAKLRKSPEDRDKAEKEVRQEGKVKDLQNEDLTLRRLSRECDTRLEAEQFLSAIPAQAILEFAAFLTSPGVFEQLKTVQPQPPELTEILAAASAKEVAEALLTSPKKNRPSLAKLLKALLGKKRAKTVALRAFAPKTDIVWEKADIARVVSEFDAYLTSQWEDGVYLKIEN
jgi:hypothetical protein